MRRWTARQLWTSAGVACVALMAAACVPAKATSSTPAGPSTPVAAAVRNAVIDTSLARGVLTSEGADVYNLSRDAAAVTASAPASNTGGNSRLGFWRAPDQDSADQQTCATWTQAPDGLQQQGAVLRARSIQGRTTAITVTHNIYFGAWWVFNVHVMDSAAAAPFHQIGTFDLREVFAPGWPDVLQAPPYPWRLCARVVGNVVSFVVWPTSDPKPAWNDARYGGSVTLPAGWSAPGDAGWYIGHLEPGKSSGFGDLSILGLLSNASSAARQAAIAELSKPASPPRQPTWIVDAP